MSRPVHLFILSTLTSILLAACGPSVPAATAAPAGASCKETADRGRDEVLAVVNQSLNCAADADCTVTSIGAACFDVCSRAVSTKLLPAVQAAMADVDSTTCATYKQDGCRFDVPPCAPPMAPRCVNGKCG
jgi:hypothetical protein